MHSLLESMKRRVVSPRGVAVLLIAAIVAMPDGVAGALKRLAARTSLRRP